MYRNGYCLKKQAKIKDRKVIGYCLTAGYKKSICVNFTLFEKSKKQTRMLPLQATHGEQ